MIETKKIEKRRKFLKLSAIGSLSALVAGMLPFGIGKAKAIVTPENKPIQIKTHPLAVKRNKKG